MNIHAALVLPGFLALVSGTSAGEQGASRGESSKPAAENVIQHAIQQAKLADPLQHEEQLAYTQISLLEELNSKGQVKSSKEKTYEVDLSTGQRRLTGLTINGRPASPEMLRREAEKERMNWHRYSGFHRPGSSDLLNPDILTRFNFTFVDYETITGRRAFKVNFFAKEGAPKKTLKDRLLRRLQGTVWIDTKTFEVTKADIGLQKELKLWGGVIASLSDFTLSMDRGPVSEHVWMTRRVSGMFEGRKLLRHLHVRMRTESKDLRPAESRATNP